MLGLRWFELSSSLRINYRKSEVFGINLDDDEPACLVNLQGCESSSLPTTYQDLPLCIGLPDFSLCEPIIAKFNKRLASWRIKYLSCGGWITLLEFVLSALHVFFLSSFKCPKKAISSLKRIMKDFLQNDLEERRKEHIVNWQQVCLPIKSGGPSHQGC